MSGLLPRPEPGIPGICRVGQVIEPGRSFALRGDEADERNQVGDQREILEILVDNAEPVEFGQSLFLIEPL
jgi:hypothetical protein